ncbi:uncharacterized protein I206_104242 [Kwoniella pini CBS 10737]|uniref:RNA recognition motif domain-containing protein n=1 Tax=Kwoniella pini CBS 10737 TaxID=1296096 RepID=A0A1B9I2G5_9TREE|nr:uncharacterized protein I206_04180 [Kwoniella pini CBS 10737]OCF49658.1 hypothetical protein I206_04180 [Kwoniella pini CBS 10737]
MSLYGGIKFASSAPAEEQSNSTNTAGPSTSSISKPPSGSINATQTTASVSEAKPQQKTGEWSAALKFAPRVNKPKPTTSSRPIGFTTTSTSNSGLGSGSNSPTTVSESKIDIIRSAEPTVILSTTGVGLGTGKIDEDEIQFGLDGLPLAKAPAMTLNSKPPPGVKRGREGEEKKKKKKKKKKNNFGQPYISNFDPDEQYDPNRPNDLGEYQAYRKRLREEKRLKLIEERKRKAQGLSSDESSYYTDSEDEAPRRDAPKMFAPPKIYTETPSAQPPVQSSNFRPPPPLTSSAPSVSSGDDAYARRAALSQQPPPATGDDAYARRLALSQQVASGDDAYARRIAMSQGNAAPPSFALPSSAPPPTFAPPSDAPVSDIPGFGSQTQASAPSHAPPIASDTANQEKEDFAKMLEDRKKAAEAIAAKFKALAGGTTGPSIPTPVSIITPQASEEDSGTGTFAEKMMRKWGHQEGSTLGIRNEGLLHALSAEHIKDEVPNVGSEKLSKRQITKQKIEKANLKNKKWIQNPNSRGKIINKNEDLKSINEKLKKGEASRIICLIGIIDNVDDIDEDLSDEIGEECSKYGIVERVVLHIVEPPPSDPLESLRIFVVFSGMAGAWRATKELDGRFFGGKKIRVTYFDEGRFDRGERDGEILG